MKFSRFIWDLYATSAKGSQAIKRCRLLPENPLSQSTEEVREAIEAGTENKVYIEKNTVIKFLNNFANNFSVASLEDAENLYNILVEEGLMVQATGKVPKSQSRKDSHERNGIPMAEIYPYPNMDWISTALYLAFPEYFYPHLFNRRFNLLSTIFEEFSIPFPPLPTKRDHDRKARYYWELNRSLYDFRKIYNMNPYELCAFLYDFSIEALEFKEPAPLPQPRMVWLTTASSIDFPRLETCNEESQYYWSSHEDAQVGDIVLIYCQSPKKHIHSIWRVMEDPHVDPFYYYHDTMWSSGDTILIYERGGK